MWCSNPSLLMEKLGILSFLPTVLTELGWGLWWNWVPASSALCPCGVSISQSATCRGSSSICSCAFSVFVGGTAGSSYVNPAGTQFFSIRSWSEGLPRDISQHWKPQVTWPLNWLYLYATNVDNLPVKLKVIVRILPTVMQKRIMILKDMKKVW